MTGTTPNGLRYPTPTDPLKDGADAIKNLATDLDPRVPPSGQWPSYVPTLTGFAGSIGRARYYKIGRFVQVQVMLSIAAGGVTGNMRLSLPVQAHAAAVILTSPVGVGTAHGTTVMMSPAFLIDQTTFGTRHTDTGEWGPSRPFTWAVGNFAAWNLQYEAAA